MVFVRLPVVLLGRVDAQLDRLRQKNPSFRLHRSDVIRTLIERAVSIEEAEAQAEVGRTLGVPNAVLDTTAERHVLDAIRAGGVETVLLSEVYGRCRGIARRDYEDALRRLEASGLIALEPAADLAALTPGERAASIIDQRGTHVRVRLTGRPQDKNGQSEPQ